MTRARTEAETVTGTGAVGVFAVKISARRHLRLQLRRPRETGPPVNGELDEPATLDSFQFHDQASR